MIIKIVWFVFCSFGMLKLHAIASGEDQDTREIMAVFARHTDTLMALAFMAMAIKLIEVVFSWSF